MRRLWQLTALAGIMLGGLQVAWAAPVPAGAIVEARASASYVPAGYAQQATIQSNRVLARVQAVEALELTQDQSLLRPGNFIVLFPHVLANGGNVASRYTFTLVNGGAGCASDTLDLGSLRLLRDANANGVIDGADTPLALNTANALSLGSGETTALLVEGRLPAGATAGAACVSLTATTDDSGLTATNNDTVTVSDSAALTLTKSETHSGIVQPGEAVIDFTVKASNVGADDARPVASDPDGTPVLVDGVPQALVLLRDTIPEGTTYVGGSLQTHMLGALRLFRLPGDPPFSYRTAADDSAAAEVAIGLPNGLARTASASMTFSVRVRDDAAGVLLNAGHATFESGGDSVEERSNTVTVPVTIARIGLAKAAGTPVAGVNADGQHDGTVTVPFTLRARNYGSVPLYKVQITDLLAGGGTRFGSYTPDAMPGPQQYTIVADSLRIADLRGPAANAAVRPDFTGESGASRLLSPGATLPPDGEVVVEFEVRFNATDRPAVLFNEAEAQAAFYTNGPPDITDESVNGEDPDPDRDGNPGDNTSQTPVSTNLPELSLSKRVSLPRRIDESGTYEFEYALTVANTGGVDAPNVRLLDNLECTFRMGEDDTPIAAWEIVDAPEAANGLLVPSASYTGKAACDEAATDDTDPSGDVPTALVLNLTDGSKPLRPDQSETISFTVRATLKPEAIGTVVQIENRAWAAAYDSNAMNPAGTGLLATASASADMLLVDPQGIVYNAVTREAVAGATVTLTRESCDNVPVTPILADEIYYGDTAGLYTYNADGSVSTTTPANGEYQFFFKSPPVQDLCAYRLTVEPPADSGLIAPSSIIPPQDGTYGSCGAVVPNAAQPSDADPTTWYSVLRAGYNADTGELCEVIHNHIPLDAGLPNGLMLEKEGSRSEAELGDFVDYTLSLTNNSGILLPGIRFSDRLPPGFAYVPDSTRLDGKAVDDPAGGRGPDLVFEFPSHSVAAGETVTLRYRLRIGVGAPTSGEAVNRALASSGEGAGRLVSNEAAWRVRVRGGVFSDEAYLFGKVFLDCDRDGVQGYEEVGIPGVRLFLEDGTGVVTDVEGKWSLYGLKPVTRVLKIDPLTLPPEARLARLNSRQGSTPGSRFVDLKKGEWHKANFAVDNCGDEATTADIYERRQILALRPDAEGEAARVRSRLDPKGEQARARDPRALPASGRLEANGGVRARRAPEAALIDLPAGASSSAAGGGETFPDLSTPDRPRSTPMPPAQAPAEPETVVLEELMPELDNTLGFIGLEHGDVLPSRQINVRVKGALGTVLRLRVNGETIGDRRVGKKAMLAETELIASEYIGVALVPGDNELEIEALDEHGKLRELRGITVVAPDAMARIELEVPETARADARTPVPVQVRLMDSKGVPVTARTAVTLESTGGYWETQDLDPAQPGTQLFIEGGMIELPLVPPAEPGDGRVRVVAGGMVEDRRISFLPELRPLMGVGIVEGTINLSRHGNIALGSPRASDAFEQELTGWSRESGEAGETTRGSARAAFYFKGTIKGEYLLSAAYDSDKDEEERLFRDIRPDEFYPIYGDSAVRSFDAQSTESLYVRIDKNRSWLLYGDFTSSASAEVRQLSKTNRSLTGLRHQFENGALRVTSYASHDSVRQFVEEFPANGTSGPYPLSEAGDLLANSERVEIVVRDRDQPDLVLSTTQLARFADYSIEPLARRLLFSSPVASLDPDLNPQSIRITYETDTGGEEFLVAGVDAQAKVGERLQFGVAAHVDEDPENVRELGAATALARLGENTTLALEAVATRSDLKGEGEAARLQLRHDGESLSADVQAGVTSPEFDNPGATISAGRTEANARLEYKMSDKTRVRGELLQSEDDTGENRRRGAALSVQHRVGNYMSAEIGTRVGDRTGMVNGGFNYGSVSSAGTQPVNPGTPGSQTDDFVTVRGRVTASLPGSRGKIFLEGEQATEENDRRVVAAGGEYQLSEKIRAFGRYELISTLFGGPYDLQSGVQKNVGIFGFESEYMKGGRLFSEYRLRDAIDGRTGQAAFGLRNTFRITDGLRLTGGFEHTGSAATVDGTPGGASTAISGGFDYGGQGELAGRLRASGTLELRSADTGDSLLNTLGFAYKLGQDWSMLSRSIVSQTQGSDASREQSLARQQIGFAYRPVDQDVWNALGRYEHKYERSGGNGLLQEARSHILSAHLNVQPGASFFMSGRYAAKWSEITSDDLASSYWAQLVYARLMKNVTPDWDLGLQAGLLFGEGGARQHTLGLETGYQVLPDLWLSVGYNLLGLHDPELTGSDYTDQGPYLRLRFKFDESLFPAAASGGTR